MVDEAEKLINMSLCKMAETRTNRRGGPSLHKHLLITSVLSKARNAYFENWYLGESEAGTSSGTDSDASDSSSSALGSKSDLSSLSSSDSSDSEEEDEPSSSMDEDESPQLRHYLQSSDLTQDNEDEIPSTPCEIMDARFFVESEIELPNDIVHCMEDMNQMEDDEPHITSSPLPKDIEIIPIHGPHPLHSASSEEMIIPDVIVPVAITETTCEPENNLTYLDLDAEPIKYDIPFLNTTPPMAGTTDGNISVEPAAPRRRRRWSLVEDEDESSEEPVASVTPLEPQNDTKEERVRTGLPVMNVCKRLRFSPVAEKITSSKESFASNSTPQFRTKLMEEEEESREEESPFLDDELNHGTVLLEASSDMKGDRRVPTSSGSSSDEDDANIMEVDELTSRVQFISFNKKSQSQNSLPSQTSLLPPLSSTAPATVYCTKANAKSSLVRSLSSPDLCSSTVSAENLALGGTSNTKSLFSSFANHGKNNGNLSCSHQVLTMSV